MTLDPGAEEIARPWRGIMPSRRRDRHESVITLALVAFVLGATLLCVGLLAPAVWTTLTGKLMQAGAPASSVSHPKQSLKPFGAIIADQLDNPARANKERAPGPDDRSAPATLMRPL